MAVHLASTTDIGSRAAVKAPTRHPDGTWNIKLTVAVFRPWRGSQATIASDPALNAAPRFARPRRRLGEEFDPAIAGCWCREPLPPRLARPKIWSQRPRNPSGRPAPNTLTRSELLYLAKTGANGRNRTDDLRFTKPLLYQLSYVGQIRGVIMPRLRPRASKSMLLRRKGVHL